MQYVDFKHDGKKVSRFGLGCMRFPRKDDGNGNSVIDEDISIPLIRKAIDNGVNYIDTAYMYPGSEVLVGKALQDGYREKVILATKLPVVKLESKEDMQRIFDEECQRLQTDHIDVYFLHNLYRGSWEKVVKFDVLDFMKKLKKEGKISYIAFSMHDQFDFYEKTLNAFDWDLSMIQYNYFDKNNQAGIRGLKAAAAKGIPVVTMESLHGGMLADLPENVREAFGDFGKGKSDVEIAYTWLYNQPEVTVVLSGINSFEQLDENLKIFETAKANVLTNSQEAYYDKARELWYKSMNVECTGCEYCVPCPVGVDIPLVFSLWNDMARNCTQKWLYQQMAIGSKKDAGLCVNCGQCVSKCPQFINIPEKLAQAHDFFMK